ncbi:MAG: dihydropteroate synthase [Campylobacterales bacterium]|nr:dihydropteroate synthase [Campylobacterales bacterium]
MLIEKLSNRVDIKKYLRELGVDDGGIDILAQKAKVHIIHIKELSVGGANILKQDALSIGADLAVPKGTVIASTPKVDCILIATTKHLKTLAKKELAQPFGLKELAKNLSEYIKKEKEYPREIMGIINANDDSFFSQSRFTNEQAISKIEEMIKEGATIIDIGAVSSAPNSAVVSETEELERIKPICKAIQENRLFEKVRFSIDSYAPSVIEYALQSGFSIVNDITGLQNDEVCKLCAEYNATAVIMHMQGTPQTMQVNPHYENVLTEVYEFFQERIEKAESFGVQDIVLDIGIGFGKSLEHNLRLLKNLEHFRSLHKRLLVGASRKSLIDKIVPTPVEERLAATLILHNEALVNGATILRVHDVKEHVKALKIFEALQKV